MRDLPARFANTCSFPAMLFLAQAALHAHGASLEASAGVADISNLVIGLSYVAISVTLGVLVYRLRAALPFHWVFGAFGLFIVACGAGHLAGVSYLTPASPVAGSVITLATAVASVATAVILPFMVPRVVTALRTARQTEQMRIELAASTRANVAKAQFMATMSHELRTPLNAIVGYTELMLANIHGDPSETHREYLERVTTSSTHLLGLIEDVLQFEKTVAGELPHLPEPCDAGALIWTAAHLLEPLAHRRGLTLVVDAPRSQMASLDAQKFRQILLNLGGNAVKFTERGTITIAADLIGGRCRLTVTDTGIGIAPTDLPRLYEPFWQADQSLTRRAQGSGLGLSVTRKLVEVMGGTIEVASTPGVGTTFTVDLPAPATPTQPRDSARNTRRVAPPAPAMA